MSVLQSYRLRGLEGRQSECDTIPVGMGSFVSTQEQHSGPVVGSESTRSIIRVKSSGYRVAEITPVE